MSEGSNLDPTWDKYQDSDPEPKSIMYLDPQHWLDPIKNSEFCQNCFKVVRPNNRNGRVPTEEYRYLYILLRTESTNPSSKKNASPKLSLPALWAVIQTDRQVVQYTAEQAGRGWMRQLFFMTMGEWCPFSAGDLFLGSNRSGELT